MKGIRIASLGIALVIGSAAMASAQTATPAPQQHGGPGMGGRGRGGMQMNGIELTDEQKAKLADINTRYQPDMMKLRDDMQAGGDRATLMKNMNELRTKMGADIRAVLTVDQQAIFDKNAAEMKARMEQMQRQAPPAL